MPNNPLETYSKLTCELQILSGINQNTLTKSGKTWLNRRYLNSLYLYNENIDKMANIKPIDLKILVNEYNKKHSQGVSFENVENGKMLCRDVCGAFNYDELCKQITNARDKNSQNFINPTINNSNSQSMPSHKKSNNFFGVDENGQCYIEIDIDQNEIDKILKQKEKFNKNTEDINGETDF